MIEARDWEARYQFQLASHSIDGAGRVESRYRFGVRCGKTICPTPDVPPIPCVRSTASQNLSVASSWLVRFFARAGAGQLVLDQEFLPRNSTVASCRLTHCRSQVTIKREYAFESSYVKPLIAHLVATFAGWRASRIESMPSPICSPFETHSFMFAARSLRVSTHWSASCGRIPAAL